MDEREPTRTRERGTLVTNSGGDGDARIAAIRRIVERHSYAKIDGVALDLTTASAIVAVYDALKLRANREKFATFPVLKMAAIAWKLLS